jgi:GNAT superfamily N-acetyltransferase
MTTVAASDPRLLEELTLNAWPPLETLLFDGWLLSFSDGYTRRANSIHPLYASHLPLAAKIAACEAAYAARGQETVFKLTSAAEDALLDQTLADLGYQSAATTSVQIAPLDPRSLAAEPQRDTRLTPDREVTLSTSLDAAWLEDFNRLSATPARFQPTMRALLQKIVPAHVFASITLDDQTVAQGLAVAEHQCVGLFDIVVDLRVRNQGLGRRVVSRLLHWGQTQAATQAYLAVMADNAPAVHLYAQLGFHEQYRYWYRHR